MKFEKSKMFKKILKKLVNSNNSYATQTHFQNVNKAGWMYRDYYRFAEEAYVKNVIAHRAINMIATSASNVEFVLYELSKKNQMLVKSHPLIKLLNKPNPMQSGKEFLETLYSYKQIAGNVYILIIEDNQKLPIELYLLRPDRVVIIPGSNLIPAAYQHKIDGTIEEFSVDPITGKSQILHIRNFNPLSDWYGLSSIEAAAYSIDQHNQAGQWNQALLQNGARPSGALVVNTAMNNGAGSLNQRQYQELKNEIDQVFSGPQNAGRPILLEGGIEWKEMSLSPKDMDFIESKHSSARDIALALGVPPQLLGIPGDNTYSNLQEARLALWEQTILPMIGSVVDNLNSCFSSYYKSSIQLSYNIENVSALASRRNEIWNRVENCNFLTINEKRNSIGLDPIEGGDIIK